MKTLLSPSLNNSYAMFAYFNLASKYLLTVNIVDSSKMVMQYNVYDVNTITSQLLIQ